MQIDPNESLSNEAAELSVIGGLLLEFSIRDDVFQILRADHFYHDQERLIFAVIRSMHESGINAIDALTVAERLEKDGQLESAGGAVMILKCMESVPHAAHSVYYANLIIECYQRRRGHQIGLELVRNSRVRSDEIGETLAEAETAIHAAMETSTIDEPTPIGEILESAIATLGDGVPVAKYIGTEWSPVDEITSGVPLGGVVVLAARPGQGKSAFALSFGLRVGESGCPVLVCEYEMKKSTVTQRCLSIISGVRFSTLEKNRLHDDDHHRVLESSSIMAKWPVFLDDSCRNQSGLLTLVRRMTRRHGVKLVIVDYLQLVEPDDRKINREQQVAGITRALKKLAMQLDIGILLLSQLNREIEKRPNKEPQLSDLRESGAVEQDADQVWFVWRPGDAVENHESPDNVGILKVAKNRNGKTGKAELMWTPETMKFSAETTDYGFA